MTNKPIILILLIIGLIIPFTVSAQQPPTAPVRVTSNQILYFGAGENSGYVEYIASGLEILAAGRNADSTWLQVNFEGLEGWIPAKSASFISGSIADLPVKGGLLDLGNGPYQISNRALRNAEIELIRIQRPMRRIGIRYNLLQSYQGATCQNIPSIPAPPNVQNASIPETERIQNELTFVQQQTELAIQVYQEICKTAGIINPDMLERLRTHVYNAYNTWDNIRKYINELGGLQYVAP